MTHIYVINSKIQIGNMNFIIQERKIKYEIVSKIVCGSYKLYYVFA